MNKGTINVEKIKSGLLAGLSNDEKITLIITLFDEEWQKDLRTELFQTLTISESEKQKGKKASPITPENTDVEIDIDADTAKATASSSQMSKKYEFDPCYKIKLLELIDKDYSARSTKDGHMIFELPNLNKVIIEKMFRKNKKNETLPAVDSATYILELDTFNLEEIITSKDKIDRSKLYELERRKKAVRYYHTKNWGDTIKEAFQIEHSNRHTEEDKRKIDEIIEKTKRTRTLRTI